jgi:hypothetical protein
MSISSVNGDPRGDFSVWRSEVGEFFPVGMGMEVKVPPDGGESSPEAENEDGDGEYFRWWGKGW